MYTKLMFAKELKEKVRNKQDVTEIGEWAFDVYIAYEDVNDSEFLHVLKTLNYMSLGDDFALSYKRLNEIADDLIVGKKDINLDY